MKDKVLEIRKKLKNGKVSLGTWQQIPNASISEILGNARYDWVAVDMEHGSISVDQLPNMIRAIELGNSLPLVRVAQSVQKDCRQALDAGAKGILAPMIETLNQIEKIISACHYPPSGLRGMGLDRAQGYGENLTKKNYISNQVNEKTICVDFSNLHHPQKNPIFTDDCHFENLGNDLYAKNLFNFVDNLYDKKNKDIQVNKEDEIIAKTLINREL